jgi:hypothetical protein
MTVPSPVCKICGETDISQFRQRKIGGKLYYVKHCRFCENELSKKYYQDHKEERIQYSKDYVSDNRDTVRDKKKEYDTNRYPLIKEEKVIYDKEYRKNNKDVINNNRKKRRKNDPTYKLGHYVSCRIRKIIKQLGGTKNGSCMKYLEYSFVQLKEHIEKQFEPWMNWGNHGVYDPHMWSDDDTSTWTWSLDHIIPQADLPYTSMTDDNFKTCWSLNNLRPLSAKQNFLDGISRVRHVRSDNK